MLQSRPEFEDFQTEITTNGYNVKDFELNHTDLTNWKPDDIVQIKGSANIKRKSTGKEKSYSTGNGTSWVGDFSQDQSGYFN